MLVLSRKRGEKIMIGPDIEVTVVDIRSDKIRLGIKAPQDVKVFRTELLEGGSHAADQEASASPTVPADEDAGDLRW